ncbi:DNA methyltransferase [Dickeya phage vB_DsoM_JA29]|uniref:DNA methylase N-4/N-6 domain-containing protein n=1 Tax=Dickeya phage vB_DsoM_JA29 TaxID=2283031 RepID=A0A384ZXJ6_9CAUD|nr:DNA methyltransferase [Dickeya phage vB_DsoM_JA29]AXG66961.1 hypothetical protein JA29_235 [Dickeya phage vB_DsoM_JA29]
MGKLSKADQIRHAQAMDLINSDKPLTFDQKLFVYENYFESATSNVRELGSFHTPLSYAWDFELDIQGYGSLVDLCAGTGILSFCYRHRMKYYHPDEVPTIVCVEINKEYCDIGKRLLPEAIWVNDDALTHDVLQYLDPCTKFKNAISNPPFGYLKTSEHMGKYRGKDFEFRIIERASQVAEYGSFIIPQQSAPFTYSGTRHYQERDSKKYINFHKDTGIELTAGIGVDSSVYKDEWKNTSILCEDVQADFTKEPNRMKQRLKLMHGDTLEKIRTIPDTSVDLVVFSTVNKRWTDPIQMQELYEEFMRVKTDNGIIIVTTGHRLDPKTYHALIKKHCPKNGVVLDPYMLRGYTGYICAKLQLKYIGIEQDPLYYSICKSFIVDAYKKFSQ